MATTNNKTKVLQKLKKPLTYFLILIIFLFLFKNIFTNWEQVKSSIMSFSLIDIVIIFVVTGSLHILNSLSWHLLIKAMGCKVTFFDSLQTWMLPSVGKYIPGMIWQYVGRVFLLSKKGVSKSQGSLVVLLDAIFTLALGSLTSLLAISFFKFPLNQSFGWIFLGVIFLPLIIVLLASNQKIISLFLNVIEKLTKKSYPIQAFKFSPFWLTALSCVTFFQFLLAGVSLFLITNSMFTTSPNLLLLFAGVYAASWIVGYLAIFAPGGLGIQELSIATLLSPFVPLPIASLAALIFRFALTLSEAILVLTVFVVSKDKDRELFSRKHIG